MPWTMLPCTSEADYDEAGAALHHALTDLSSIVSEFESAIQLHSMTESLLLRNQDSKDFWTIQRWPFMAARIGAMCIYDFWLVTQTINSTLLPRCDRIRAYVDFDSKKEAQRLFACSFPNIADIRNASAHHGSLNDTPEKREENSVPIKALDGIGIIGGKENSGQVTIGGSFSNGKFIYSYKGKVVSYSPNSDTVRVLLKVLSLWRAAFLPVEVATGKMFRDANRSKQE